MLAGRCVDGRRGRRRRVHGGARVSCRTRGGRHCTRRPCERLGRRSARGGGGRRVACPGWHARRCGRHIVGEIGDGRCRRRRLVLTPRLGHDGRRRDRARRGGVLASGCGVRSGDSCRLGCTVVARRGGRQRPGRRIAIARRGVGARRSRIRCDVAPGDRDGGGDSVHLRRARSVGVVERRHVDRAIVACARCALRRARGIADGLGLGRAAVSRCRARHATGVVRGGRPRGSRRGASPVASVAAGLVAELVAEQLAERHVGGVLTWEVGAAPVELGGGGTRRGDHRGHACSRRSWTRRTYSSDRAVGMLLPARETAPAPEK